jgi:DNA polymerase-3 subunit delta'
MADSFSRILAHNRQISGLKRLIERGATEGVFAFVGPAHLGVADVAKAFCASVLGGSIEELIRHPDAIVLTPETKESGARAHDIDRVRDLLHRIGQRSLTGKMIVVIEEADVLNAATQNALLKTLEEPAPGTTIVLVATDEASLLPTIRSRVTTIRFFGDAPEASSELKADAERLCHASRVERLLAAQDLAKRDGVDFDLLFGAIVDCLHDAGRSTAKNLDAILVARDRLNANGNSTVVLTELAVQCGQYE